MYRGKLAGNHNKMKRTLLAACCLLAALWMQNPDGGCLMARAAEPGMGGAGIPEGGDAQAPEQTTEDESTAAPENQETEGEPEQAPEVQIPAGENQGLPAGSSQAAPENESVGENTPAEAVPAETVPAEGEEAWEGTVQLLMGVRVRSAPGIASAVVGTLNESTVASAVGRLNDENGDLWYHIRSEDPLMEGYIKADLAEVIDGEEGLDPESFNRVKSNFALDGSNRLNIGGQIPAMSHSVGEAGGSSDESTGKMSLLAFVHTRMDLRVAVLTVTAAFAAILLYRFYVRFMAELQYGGVYCRKKKSPKHRKARKKTVKRHGRDTDAGRRI